MAHQKSLYRNIIENRSKAVLALVAADRDTSRIERELALLILDILGAVQTKALTFRQGKNYVAKIAYAMRTDTEEHLSEEARDLLNEMIILDEAGTAYGPDFAFVRGLVVKILQRDERETLPRLKKFTEGRRTRQRHAKTLAGVA